eukprot:GEMP01035767.1.p1 GENE.GEMP01035767.1~~GEMP01035767.1.p1  ORF type:complete len:271 (+),score=71.81 GEMP01035767.1:171-983(+)
MTDQDDAFVNCVVEASTVEQEAIAFDQQGDVKSACSKYRESAAKLDIAAHQLAPRNHPDIESLVIHRKQLMSRVAYLEQPTGGAERRPIQDHIQAAQLTLQAADAATFAKAKVDGAGGGKVVAAAAGIGAVGGLVVLGTIFGGGVGIIAGAGAGAYAATRSDKVGEVARSAAGGAISTVHKAKDFNEKHELTGKALTLGQSIWSKAKEVNEKHDITGKVAHGAAATAAKAKEVNEKYKITDKAGGAMSSGMEKASEKLSRVSRKSDTSDI